MIQDCGTNLIQTVVNPRVVRLTGNLTDYRPEYNEEGDIVSLTCNDYCYKIGMIIRPKPRYAFKVNHIIPQIKDKQILCYDLLYANRTRASYFVLPLLGGSRELFLWDKNLINAFVGTPYDDNCIALLFRFSGDVLFGKFEKALESFRSFRRRYDPDPYHVMFVLQQKELLTEQGSIELISALGSTNETLGLIQAGFNKINDLKSFTINTPIDFIQKAHQLCV